MLKVGMTSADMVGGSKKVKNMLTEYLNGTLVHKCIPEQGRTGKSFHVSRVILKFLQWKTVRLAR